QPQLADVLVVVAPDRHLPAPRDLRDLAQDGFEQRGVDALAAQHDHLVSPAPQRRQSPRDDPASAWLRDELRDVADAVAHERHGGAIERGEDQLAVPIGVLIDDLEEEAELIQMVSGAGPAFHAAGTFRAPVAHEHPPSPDVLDELPGGSRKPLAGADD